MKVIITIILVLNSVLASDSGPYLPSGWRPLGPAFELPSRSFVTKISGSEALSEYGSPEHAKLQNINQDLQRDDFKETFYSEVTNGRSKEEIYVKDGAIDKNIVINIEETSEAIETEKKQKEISLSNSEEYITPIASGEFIPLFQQELQQVTLPPAFTEDFYVPIDATLYEVKIIKDMISGSKM